MKISRLIVLSLALTSFFALPCMAAEPARPWTDVTELSFILTDGNSETMNLATTNKFVYKLSAVSNVTVDAAALKTDTTSRAITNPAGSPVVTKTATTTAESYSLGGKYRQTIQGSLFGYGSGDWMRNRFAGVEDRYTIGAGLGTQLIKDDRNNLVGELGLTLTDESRVGNTKDSSGGVRGFFGYNRVLSETSKFTSELELLQNLKTSEDFRGKWTSGVTASMTQGLALKVGYTLIYTNQPIIKVVPGDTSAISNTSFELDSLDTIVSVSLVISI